MSHLAHNHSSAGRRFVLACVLAGAAWVATAPTASASHIPNDTSTYRATCETPTQTNCHLGGQASQDFAPAATTANVAVPVVPSFQVGTIRFDANFDGDTSDPVGPFSETFILSTPGFSDGESVDLSIAGSSTGGRAPLVIVRSASATAEGCVPTEDGSGRIITASRTSSTDSLAISASVGDNTLPIEPLTNSGTTRAVGLEFCL